MYRMAFYWNTWNDNYMKQWLAISDVHTQSHDTMLWQFLSGLAWLIDYLTLGGSLFDLTQFYYSPWKCLGLKTRRYFPVYISPKTADDCWYGFQSQFMVGKYTCPMTTWGHYDPHMAVDYIWWDKIRPCRVFSLLQFKGVAKVIESHCLQSYWVCIQWIQALASQ